MNKLKLHLKYINVSLDLLKVSDVFDPLLYHSTYNTHSCHRRDDSNSAFFRTNVLSPPISIVRSMEIMSVGIEVQSVLVVVVIGLKNHIFNFFQQLKNENSPSLLITNEHGP